MEDVPFSQRRLMELFEVSLSEKIQYFLAVSTTESVACDISWRPNVLGGYTITAMARMQLTHI